MFGPLHTRFHRFIFSAITPGMSNWRPHGLFNVARCDLFKLNYHLKLKVIHKIWLIFVHFLIKLAKICLKLTQRVICNSKLRPAVSFVFLALQPSVRHTQWFEFDMPALHTRFFCAQYFDKKILWHEYNFEPQDSMGTTMISS